MYFAGTLKFGSRPGWRDGLLAQLGEQRLRVRDLWDPTQGSERREASEGGSRPRRGVPRGSGE